MIRLTSAAIDYHALTDAVVRPHCGGVVLFLGTVRDLTGDVRTVFLDYEAYAPMAEKKLAEIEADARAKWPVGDVALVAAVAAPHRAAAFEATEQLVALIKQRVPIWKRQHLADGVTEWVGL